jgi:hypothetical protein
MLKVFQIPPPDWPDERKILEDVHQRIEEIISERINPGDQYDGDTSPETTKGLADIATNAWRARNKLTIDTARGDARDEIKRVLRHVDAIFQNFQDMGLEVKDHTGSRFDYGLPLKVVATQPTEGMGTETIIETIKPTVYWNNQIIQMGEVVIATPASPKNKP